jgi:hypothetical protein
MFFKNDELSGTHFMTGRPLYRALLNPGVRMRNHIAWLSCLPVFKSVLWPAVQNQLRLPSMVSRLALALALFLTGSLASAQPVYTNFTIQLGPTSLVPNANPSIPTYPYFPDGHVTFMPDNATNNVYQMYWAGGTSYRSLGTNVSLEALNPGTALIGAGLSATDFDNGGAWLMSVCRTSPSNLSGFYHGEDWNWPGYSNPGNIAWKSMAYCTSTNNGKTWTKAGQFLTSSTPKPVVPTWGGTADACVVYDQANARWVCLFSEDSICMAVSTNAVPLPGTWKKYYNGSFSTPGLGGLDTPVPGLGTVPGANPSVHFNTYLQRWVIIWEDWNGVGLYLSTSADLLNWTAPVVLVSVVSPQQAWYGTIIGRTDVEASRNGMLYYAYWPNVNSGLRQFLGATLQFNLPDTLGDGVPDAWKIYYFGSIHAASAAASADPDGDGQNNLSEYLAGTNPTNSSSLLQLQNIQPAGNGSMALNWQSVAHKYYTLETSTNLVNWMPIAQNLPATSPLNQYTNFASVPGTSFYRVSVAPY